MLTETEREWDWLQRAAGGAGAPHPSSRPAHLRFETACGVLRALVPTAVIQAPLRGLVLVIWLSPA